MKNATAMLFGRVLQISWLSALGVALFVTAQTTERRTRQVEENATFCDPFGYLQMAQDIRHSASTPQFNIESRHTRLLIEFMQSQDQPVPLWDEMVAPLAYHYMPVSNKVAVQYPPGAGFLLALFPEGKALHGLNRSVIAIFLVAGLAVLVVAAVTRRPLSAGLVMLAWTLGLDILARLDNASFSINALLAPLLVSGLCLSIAWALKSDCVGVRYAVWFLVLLAGLSFGFAVLARLPVILLLPGVLLLLWPGKLRTFYKNACVPFVLGVFLGGMLPQMVHQSRVVGAWYLSTYAHGDAEPPQLKAILPNISYYFGPGKSSAENWVLPVILAGCVGLMLWSKRDDAALERAPTFFPRLSWWRLSAAALLVLGLSALYFLTHTITAHYYPWPALFGAVLMLALGAFALERNPWVTIRKRDWLRRALLMLGLLLSIAPGIVVIARAWSRYTPRVAETRPKQFSLPPELADESAWVWACELSGTLWYYARKPAHKLTSTNPETRELVYRFVISRGERQYIIPDGAGMQDVADEIVRLGGTLERRGEVDGYPYFLIHWPPNVFGKNAGS